MIFEDYGVEGMRCIIIEWECGVWCGVEEDFIIGDVDYCEVKRIGGVCEFDELLFR